MGNRLIAYHGLSQHNIHINSYSLHILVTLHIKVQFLSISFDELKMKMSFTAFINLLISI